MQLTTRQRQQLLKLREFHTTPPTISTYVRDGRRASIHIVIVGSIGIGFFLWAGWPVASGFFGGMVLATLVRDVGWYRRIVKSWPLQREVTDWKRVEQLLESSDGPAA
jgi:hypothetical protein